MRLSICAALVAGALAAPAADAATLQVSQRVEYYDFYSVSSVDVTYNAADGEANDVLVLTGADRHLVQWLDTGAPIAAAAGSELGAPRPSGPWGACFPVRLSGTLLGQPAALGEGTCVAYDHIDPICQLNLNPMCQGGTVFGFDRINVRTGDNDDVVRAVDGEQQRIDCGTGTDAVLADEVDLLASCEQVTTV